MKKKLIIIGSLIIIMVLGIISYKFFFSGTTDILENSSMINTDVETDSDDIDWSQYETQVITLSSSITLDEEGIYQLNGTLNDGCVTINTDGNIKIILNGISISNSSGPAIYIQSAKNAYIQIADGTTNYLSDSKSYSGYDDEVNATIYSKDDLVFEGEGTLNIEANYEDAIVSKDDLNIYSATFNINSADDAIRGKDSVYIVDGTFNINSDGDAIKSTNDTDDTKGFILIENGTFTINAQLDGIQAETKLLIYDGTFEITTGGSSSNSSSSSNSWGSWSNNTSTDTNSAKGLKAKDNLVISNGTFNLDTSDDAIHSNSYIGIKAGLLNISSGDDAIHADSQIIIDNGTINISKSYEGIEASSITINNGSIDIISTDDGINICGGNDSSSMDRQGQNSFSDSSNQLIINDGTIYVNATGDGIDVNGSAYINGGVIHVDGPTDNSNAALDYDQEFVMNGGELIAVGSSGMALNISSSSTIYGALINLSTSYSASSNITIEDSNGNSILSYTPSKSFSSIVISTSSLKKDETYTLKINNTEVKSFTLSSIATTVGSTSNNGGGNNMQPNNNNNGGMNNRR